MKRVCCFLIMLVFLLTGCGVMKLENKTAAVLDTAGFRVGFDIHMTSNLIFIPNYFGEVYGVGSKYEEAIDEWGDLRYSKTERKLLEVEAAIEGSDRQYFPDDIAYVKQALGLLYYDMAEYGKAYDYLIDAYVTMEEIYGDKKGTGAQEQFYPEAVSLTLCHYYYTIGDYDRCLKEIQTLREYNDGTQVVDDEVADYQFFISYILNDIEANIYKDRGEYESAYNLYSKNCLLCVDYYNNNEDPTFGYMLAINAFTQFADWHALFTTNADFVEKADTLYVVALNICDQFDGDLKEQRKSEILLKQGAFFSNFSDRLDEARAALYEALTIQLHFYESGKADPGFVETSIKCAEYFGFVKGDKDEATYHYDAALDAAQGLYGENHPETAKVYESMGRFYGNKLREVDQAIAFFDKAIEIYRNLLIENNVLVAGMYLQLAGCYKAKDENEKSDEYLERAYSMYGALGIHILQQDGTWK